MSSQRESEKIEIFKDPIFKILEYMNQLNDVNMILTGPRHSGKSTILEYYCKINSNLWVVELSNKVNLNFSFSQKQLNYLCELYICENLIDYVQKNNITVYLNFFKFDHVLIKRKLSLIKKIIEKKSFDFFKYNELFEIGIYLKYIINKIKEKVNIEKLIILLDNFGSIECPDQNFQKILIDYCKYFDNFIITTDDYNIRNNKYVRADLRLKGYELIDVDYAKDIDIAKSIIRKNYNYYACINLEFFNKSDYEKIIKECDGNINMLFEIIEEYYKNFLTDRKSLKRCYDEIVDNKKRIKARNYVKKINIGLF